MMTEFSLSELFL